MKRKFNTIKKSRKKSKDIDEKIEYLNKECQKTGLNEITMSTSGIYQGTTSNPNSGYAEFTAKNFNGVPFAMSGDSNLGQGSFGGGSIRASDGAALSPDGTTTQTKGGIGSGGFKLAIPGERPSPSHRMTGPILWYWTGSSWGSLEYNSAAVHGNQPYPYGGDNAGWGYWGSNFLGFPMLRSDGAPLASLFNTIDNFDPKDSVPETIVFTKDRLDDPLFTPINIDGLSGQGFDYLKKKAEEERISSSGANYDLFNWINKTYGGAASNWYEQNPTLPHQSNPFIPRLEAPYVPLASNPNAPDVQYDPFANEVKPSLGAKPGDMLAGFFGDSPKEKAEKELKKVVDKGRSGMFFNNALQFAHQAASGQNYGTASKPRNEAAFIKKYGVTPQQFLKYADSGDVKHLKDIQVDNILNQSYQPEGNVLSEAVKLGHFEPELLNVDINDIRKGIMPEFPKDPPPKMIDGYSEKSNLAPKVVKGEATIKITSKDLLKFHKLKKSEIDEFMNDIKEINDYLQDNPKDLLYVQERYPKDDPRLAELNWKMDQKLGASKEYMDKHFPENQKLYKKLIDNVNKNIELTGHKKAPKFEKKNFKTFREDAKRR